LPVPAYDYHCDVCGSTYELRQGFDAETSHTCEECGKGTAKRVLTAPRVVFKGSGWYVTDFRDKGKPKKSDGDGASTSSESSSTPAATPADSAPKAAASAD